MKKLTTFGIALLATATFLNANAEDKKLETKSTSSTTMLNYKKSNLDVGIYEIGNVNSLKLNIAITKDEGKTATVKLMDENGYVLNEDKIGKNSVSYNFRFDFSTAKSGKYYVEITSGERIITREIIKSVSTLSY